MNFTMFSMQSIRSGLSVAYDMFSSCMTATPDYWNWEAIPDELIEIVVIPSQPTGVKYTVAPPVMDEELDVVSMKIESLWEDGLGEFFQMCEETAMNDQRALYVSNVIEPVIEQSSDSESEEDVSFTVADLEAYGVQFTKKGLELYFGTSDRSKVFSNQRVKSKPKFEADLQSGFSMASLYYATDNFLFMERDNEQDLPQDYPQCRWSGQYRCRRSRRWHRKTNRFKMDFIDTAFMEQELAAYLAKYRQRYPASYYFDISSDEYSLDDDQYSDSTEFEFSSGDDYPP